METPRTVTVKLKIFEGKLFRFLTLKYKNIMHTNLIVPVGEGTGEFGVDLASGILILSDE
jgi:hypothetical protein